LGTTNVTFTNVVANSSPVGWNFYNPATGAFTVPQDGTGIYTLTAHIGLNYSVQATPTTATVEMKVNGGTIIKSDETMPVLVTPTTKWYDLTIVYPLAAGSNVTVTTTSSVAGAVTIDPLSSFSLVKNVSL
jgi:hypothetical protein